MKHTMKQHKFMLFLAFTRWIDLVCLVMFLTSGNKGEKRQINMNKKRLNLAFNFNLIEGKSRDKEALIKLE